MSGFSFFINTTKCMACRGCQVACQAYHNLSAEKTVQKGDYQNPADLSGSLFRLVRFSEHQTPAGPKWYFFSDACRHCLEPPCRDAANSAVAKAVEIDPSGAVIYTDQTKQLGAKKAAVIGECPYNIPRLNRKTGLLVKCDMCLDRLNDNLEPACAKACPTGAITFGKRDRILKLASATLKAAQKKYGDRATLINPDEVRVIYLIADDPEMYWEYAAY